ncbi:hypothetical protein MIDIC_20059 [Alphaproteobacteria bacterium]
MLEQMSTKKNVTGTKYDSAAMGKLEHYTKSLLNTRGRTVGFSWVQYVSLLLLHTPTLVLLVFI